MTTFRIEVPAKWVLAGEHAVLRGARALAFPLPKYQLVLRFSENHPSAPAGAGMQMTRHPFSNDIFALIDRGFELVGCTPPDRGWIDIESTIPLGAGLGSSAAICVAVANFVIWKTQGEPERVRKLATQLEDRFHGKSSGMDVATIAGGVPILYQRGHDPKPVLFQSLPNFEFFDSGKRGSTKACIERVQRWREANPKRADALDQQMDRATELCLSALQGTDQLIEGINLAQDCFEVWGLIDEDLFQQKAALLRQGAQAVKLTGAGMGGFWVVLWPLTNQNAIS